MPPEIQYVPVVPAPNFQVGTNDEQGLVMLVAQTVIGNLQFPINPNSAIELSRVLFKTAKALNLKLAARAGQSVQGRDARSGGLLLSKPAEVVQTEAESDPEFLAGMEPEPEPAPFVRPRTETFGDAVAPSAEAADGFAVPQHGAAWTNLDDDGEDNNS